MATVRETVQGEVSGFFDYFDSFLNTIGDAAQSWLNYDLARENADYIRQQQQAELNAYNGLWTYNDQGQFVPANTNQLLTIGLLLIGGIVILKMVK